MVAVQVISNGSCKRMVAVQVISNGCCGRTVAVQLISNGPCKRMVAVQVISNGCCGRTVAVAGKCTVTDQPLTVTRQRKDAKARIAGVQLLASLVCS